MTCFCRVKASFQNISKTFRWFSSGTKLELKKSMCSLTGTFSPKRGRTKCSKKQDRLFSPWTKRNLSSSILGFNLKSEELSVKLC